MVHHGMCSVGCGSPAAARPQTHLRTSVAADHARSPERSLVSFWQDCGRGFVASMRSPSGREGRTHLVVELEVTPGLGGALAVAQSSNSRLTGEAMLPK